MLTFKAETVDDINNALSRLGRLPRRQRVAYLAKAKSKLMMRARRGEDVEDIRFRVHRLYAQEKRRLDRDRAKPEPSPYDVVDKRLYELEVGEAKYPKSDRYHGMLVVRGEDGFYVTDGEDRTDSYGWYGAIPDEEIEALVDQDHPDR